jgi:hypothetical protein
VPAAALHFLRVRGWRRDGGDEGDDKMMVIEVCHAESARDECVYACAGIGTPSR